MNNAIPTNMAEGNTLKSYLVSIGVNFDQEKLKDIQNKLKNFANMMKQAFLKPVEAIKNFASKFVENFKKPLETVKNFTGKMSKAFTDINKKIKAFMQTMQKAFSVVTGFASSVISASVAVGKFMNNLAKQDLALDNFSRRMGVSKKTAREFKSAVDSLGASVEEIQFNPELLKQYKDLVADGRKMAVAGDYDKAMANVRSLGFEFVRLKNEANYVFQWVGYYLTKYLAGPMKAAKKYFQGFNEWIIKNTPQISAKIAEVMARIADVFGSVFKFFGKVGTALSQWWSGQPTWVKNMMAGAGILGAIFLGAQNPLIAIGMVIAGIFLLIEDYQKWTEGKKSAFGKIWEAITKACQKVKPVIEDWKNKAIKWFGEVKEGTTSDLDLSDLLASYPYVTDLNAKVFNTIGFQIQDGTVIWVLRAKRFSSPKGTPIPFNGSFVTHTVSESGITKKYYVPKHPELGVEMLDYRFCDGQNVGGFSTINMTNRFLMCRSSATAGNGNSGSDTIKLQTAHLPTNKFGLTLTCNNWNKKFSLEGTFKTTNEDKTHTHNAGFAVLCAEKGQGNQYGVRTITGDDLPTTGASTPHTYQVKVTFKDINITHKHGISGNVQLNSSSQQTFSVVSQHYKIAYIQRIY